MRKILSLVLSVTLLFMMCGCGKNAEESSGNRSDSWEESTYVADVSSKEDDQLSGESEEQESSEEVEPEDEEGLPLIDSSKELVYDYVYEPALELDSLTNYDGDEFAFHDVIHLPYINVDTDAARRFNSDVEIMAEHLADLYQEAFENDYNFGSEFNYYYTVNDDVVSVVLNLTNNDFFSSYFSTFNFSNVTGEEISNEELLQRYGVEDNLYQYIVQRYFYMYSVYMEDNPFIGKELIGISLMTTWNKLLELEPFEDIDIHRDSFLGTTYMPAFKENYNRFFVAVDEHNEFAFVTDNYYPAGGGYLSFVEPFLPEEESEEHEDYELSSLYCYIAGELGIDPSSADAPFAFTASLGGTREADAIVQKLTPLVRDAEMTPDSIVPIRMSDLYGNSEQLYLVIPRYKDTATVFYSYHYSDDLMEMERHGAGTSAIGAFTLGCNSGELVPYVGARIQYLDKFIVVDFMLSGRTGELEATEETMDISAFLDSYAERNVNLKEYEEERRLMNIFINGAIDIDVAREIENY